MKKYLILGLSILLNLQVLLAQQKTYNFPQTNLIQVLNTLEKQYDFIFAYDYELIKNLNVAQKNYQSNGIEHLLSQILSPLDLDFRITAESYILIIRKKISSSDKDLLISDNLRVICGHLKAFKNKEPLSFANILIKGKETGVSADDQGNFSLQAGISPEDTLEFSYIGYQTRRLPASEFIDKPCQTVLLETEGIAIPEVLIRDFSISFLKPSRQGQGIQLNPDQLGRLPGWGENDILRMVQLLPGIHSSNESAADIHIRGGTPDQNLILWEDIPILHIGHFFGMFTAVNPNISKSIKVYPGNFDASQGGRVSGLIDIKGPGIVDSLNGNLTLNLINAQAYLNVPVIKEKASLQIAFRRSYTDIVQSPTYKKLFNQISGNGKIEDNQQQVSEENLKATLSPTFYFNDFNVKWNWKIGKSTEWTSSLYRGSDHLDYLVLFDEPFFYLRSEDEIDLSNLGFSTVLEQTWSPRLQSNLKWVHSRFQNDFQFHMNIKPWDQMERNWRVSQMNDMKEIGLQWNNSWEWLPGQSLNFGYHRSVYSADFRVKQKVPDQFEKTFEENIDGTLHSMYLDMDLNFEDQLLVDFGLRHIRYAPYRNFLLLPRLSINYQPIRNFPLQIKGAVGRYTQFVNQMITDNDLGLSEQIWIIAGEEQGLPLVQSKQWSAGLRYRKRGWIIDAEFYEKETSNLTTLNLQFDLPQENPYSLGNADIRGFDFLIRKKWKHYNSWLSWSVGRVKYQFVGLNENRPFFASHDQRHTINWTNLLEYPRWGLSLSWYYNTGQPFTQPETIETYFNEETQMWEYALRLPPRNAERLPPYQRVDISAYWRWPSTKGHSFVTGIAVFNLLDQKNIRDRKYYVLPADESTNTPPQIFNYDQPALSFTPNLFVEFSW